ncbi:hypothetical protein Dimus_005762 [Dionaea muscipula]
MEIAGYLPLAASAIRHLRRSLPSPLKFVVFTDGRCNKEFEIELFVGRGPGCCARDEESGRSGAGVTKAVAVDESGRAD